MIAEYFAAKVTLCKPEATVNYWGCTRYFRVGRAGALSDALREPAMNSNPISWVICKVC